MLISSSGKSLFFAPFIKLIVESANDETTYNCGIILLQSSKRDGFHGLHSFKLFIPLFIVADVLRHFDAFQVYYDWAKYQGHNQIFPYYILQTYTQHSQPFTLCFTSSTTNTFWHCYLFLQTQAVTLANLWQVVHQNTMTSWQSDDVTEAINLDCFNFLAWPSMSTLSHKTSLWDEKILNGILHQQCHVKHQYGMKMFVHDLFHQQCHI